MIHLVGYSALTLNLFSMMMKSILKLRILSLVANAIYLVYGVFLNSPPFIIGCGISIVIHAIHINKLMRENSEKK